MTIPLEDSLVLVVSCAESTRPDDGGDDFSDVRLDDGRSPCIDQLDLGPHGIYANDLVTVLRETTGGNCPDVAHPENADFHSSFLSLKSQSLINGFAGSCIRHICQDLPNSMSVSLEGERSTAECILADEYGVTLHNLDQVLCVERALEVCCRGRKTNTVGSAGVSY